MGYTRRVFLFVLLVCFSPALAVDFDAIVEKIAKDLGDRLDTREYSTIAIWDIGNSGSVTYNEEDFLSRLKIALVRQRNFDVVDRTRLQQLLEEIEFTGSGLVDPDTMKRLGEMYGIDLFLYGTFYDNELAGEKNSTLIMKAIDVERSYIAWAYEIPVYGEYLNTSLDNVISAVVKDLDNEKSYLASKGIRKISFWDLGNVPRQKELQVIDKLIVKLVRHGWQVVDRENLAKLLEEIRFTQDSGLISSATAQELGKMYGIDGFIYGRGTINFGGESELLLEMIDTEKGILPWAYNAVGTLEGAVLEEVEEIQYAEAIKETERKAATQRREITRFPFGIGISLGAQFPSCNLTVTGAYDESDIVESRLLIPINFRFIYRGLYWINITLGGYYTYSFYDNYEENFLVDATLSTGFIRFNPFIFYLEAGAGYLWMYLMNWEGNPNDDNNAYEVELSSSGIVYIAEAGIAISLDKQTELGLFCNIMIPSDNFTANFTAYAPQGFIDYELSYENLFTTGINLGCFF